MILVSFSNIVYADDIETFQLPWSGKEKYLDQNPPTITINNPINTSTIRTDSTLLDVTTNENAVCEYSLCRYWDNKIYGIGGGGCAAPRDMSTTGSLLHQQLITGLSNTINTEHYKEWYSLNLKCSDNFGNSDKEFVTFYVNIHELNLKVIPSII